MLLSNLSAFNKISASSRTEIGFKDENDPEIERMYNSSPPIEENFGSFDMEEMVTLENIRASDPAEKVNIKKARESKEAIKKSSPVREVDHSTKALLDHFATQESLKSSANEGAGGGQHVSALTKQLKESTRVVSTLNAAVERGMVSLTIYLPDFDEMKIKVKADITFLELINQCLLRHKSLGLRPPLEYNAIYKYEVRIHEGDGEPDRDFPAIEPNKTLKAMNLDEYCLCEKDGDIRASRKMSAAPPLMDPPAPRVVDRRDSFGDSDDGMGLGVSQKSGENENGDEEEILVTIRFPENDTSMDILCDESTRMMDLLSKIAEKYRIRLLTGEFTFVMSKGDQHRLMLMSPVVDNKALVKSVGANVFEIHNKLYADSAKNHSAKKKMTFDRADKPNDSVSDSFKFTDATANAYKDWLVVKKNRFGRKQERVFGVDGKRIYNTRRGQSRNDAGVGVQRAERDISTIRNIEVLEGDPSTFRITWLDDRDVYNIEYTCEAGPRECREIVAKISFLMARLKSRR